MVISHKYKFIFIKTRRTAGTSIEVFLSGICGEHDIVTPIRPAVQLSFDQYLQGGKLYENSWIYSDRQGKIIGDDLLQFERLDEELTRVFAKLGVPFQGSLGIRAKSEYRKDRRPYQELYPAAQRNHIAQTFKREIELHG